MFKLFLLVLYSTVLFSTVYSFKIESIDGDQIDFSSFQGKKILVVNTASESRFAQRQLPDLEQLYQKYKDSLVVIAVPSNSFGSEPESSGKIKRLLKGRYDAHYIISDKIEVSGEGAAPLYQWLTTASSNGVMNSKVEGDFHKYLIGSDGRLMGYFIPEVGPMDSLMLIAIEGKFNSIPREADSASTKNN